MRVQSHNWILCHHADSIHCVESVHFVQQFWQCDLNTVSVSLALTPAIACASFRPISRNAVLSKRRIVQRAQPRVDVVLVGGARGDPEHATSEVPDHAPAPRDAAEVADGPLLGGLNAQPRHEQQRVAMAELPHARRAELHALRALVLGGVDALRAAIAEAEGRQ